jgi:hypothetical protein
MPPPEPAEPLALAGRQAIQPLPGVVARLGQPLSDGLGGRIARLAACGAAPANQFDDPLSEFCPIRRSRLRHRDPFPEAEQWEELGQLQVLECLTLGRFSCHVQMMLPLAAGPRRGVDR